ncbi:MAG: TatA/E family twin arginine-targeting protein translocase [Synechococcaceae cyanobacterium RM1_1_27]|nr:TatA/E family twin arginine-targeting protein translocase [Synechococcaceae cyanobacterium RM1_1_27]
MNFLGVGLPEMILIFVVALLVFGPRKLPEISRTIAKSLKTLQDASKEFETTLNREARELATGHPQGHWIHQH